ncbi:MAG: peptide ABC transporter substrate-binding protein [Chloroflexota bacterium]|nr:peptide ABC transporter substrate-binding protein [Chloroflexota bacterium]
MRCTRPQHSTAIRRATLFAAFAFFLSLLLAACGGAATQMPANVAATATGGSASAARPTTGATAPAAAGSPTAVGSAITGATTAASSPSAAGDPRGAGPTKRGGGGTLHLLWWQAPTILNLHLAQGTKDADASRLIEEPLASTSLNASSPDVPVLAKSIPSAADGSVAADGKSVTWKLKDGVTWSDGTPFTAADVKATWQYIMKPENGSTTVSRYDTIVGIETPDATTVTIAFKDPTALWYIPFTNFNGVVLQKAQIDTCNPDPKSCVINTAPVGTGPYKVKSFTSGDNVQYSLNDRYREANAPYYDAVDLKGGGDAGTAAKAVQAGQVDYAWNLQVTPDVSKQITDAGKVLDQVPGSGVEQIIINLSDPNKEVNGEKSSPTTQHPFLSDPKVRQAISYLVDRDSMAKNLYAAGKANCNILIGIPPAVQSKNTTCGFDVAKANQLLDDAGWKKGSDGIRAKNGVQMKVVFGSSVNAVREKEEQIIKQAFGQAGIQMDIKNADAGVYFGQPDNADAASRMERDMEMLTRTADFPDMQSYLSTFTAKDITQKSNGWKGNNYGRYSDPQYDALYDQLTKELNPEKRTQLEIQMNDLLVGSDAVIPLVDRYSNNGHRADLINTAPTPWDSFLWNIAYWQIKK